MSTRTRWFVHEFWKLWKRLSKVGAMYVYWLNKNWMRLMRGSDVEHPIWKWAITENYVKRTQSESLAFFLLSFILSMRWWFHEINAWNQYLILHTRIFDKTFVKSTFIETLHCVKWFDDFFYFSILFLYFVKVTVKNFTLTF